MTDPLFSVSGRAAVVTGGFGRLGAELTAGLHERGMCVAAIDLREEPREGAADVGPGLAAGEIRHFGADVTDRAALEDVLGEVEAAWGVPDLLVNAAAIDAPPGAPVDEVGPFEGVPLHALERVVDVNVLGTLVPCQVFGAAMARQGRGSIVNVASVYGMVSPDQSLYDFRRAEGDVFYKPVAYAVSKSAVLNLTRYLATYWGESGVRVNTLTPHGIADGQPDAFVDAFARRSPMRRLMTAGEAVGPIVFLASDASSYVTGANIVVDGGWTAW